MESLAKLLLALSSFAWPGIFALLALKFFEPARKLVESANQRKFTIKVGNNELTMEEASEQQRQIVGDVQSKLAELEKRLATSIPISTSREEPTTPAGKRILWVDDNPKNNSFVIATLEEKGARVDIATSTDEGVEKFRLMPYDIVISDMGRPESKRAGIDLVKEIRKSNRSIPFYIYCGSWAARNLRSDALEAGANDITASSTTLLSRLLSNAT
jgi:CheY-like chemotaxis protein